MSTKAKSVVAPTTPAAEVQVAPKPTSVLSVKQGIKYAGARAAWYAVLLAHEGKPAEEFLKATTEKKPSLPKSGVPEASAGWLRFFTKAGVATLVSPTK